jgi:hypothetical protein
VTEQTPQTITPERQIVANQVAGVFNSISQYLTTIAHAAENGDKILTKELDAAFHRLQEASFWAIRHVLNHGVPKQVAVPVDQAKVDPNAPPTSTHPDANDEPLAPVADPLPVSNASGTEPV